MRAETDGAVTLYLDLSYTADTLSNGCLQSPPSNFGASNLGQSAHGIRVTGAELRGVNLRPAPGSNVAPLYLGGASVVKSVTIRDFSAAVCAGAICGDQGSFGPATLEDVGEPRSALLVGSLHTPW